MESAYYLCQSYREEIPEKQAEQWAKLTAIDDPELSYP